MKNLPNYENFLSEGASALKPSDFAGAKINSVFFSAKEKHWVVDTDKGYFIIDKALEFKGKK
jgi:hypothetical protein